MTKPDLRPQLAAAQEWVAQLTANVSEGALDAPTPCDEFDVRHLLGHLLAVQDRIERIAATGGLNGSSTMAEVPADPAAEMTRRSLAAQQAWATGEPEELWTRTVEAPFGVVPGGVAVTMYLAENLTHGWDLAVATSQASEADPALVAPALAAMRQGLPAQGREQWPFGEVVESAPGAGLTEQLANWSGHSR